MLFRSKPTGNDLREEKFTLPLLYVLNRADAPDPARRDEMRAIAYSEGELDDDTITRLYLYARQEGGIQYAYSTMERLHAEASSLLDKTFGHDDSSLDPFRAIFRFIIERHY